MFAAAFKFNENHDERGRFASSGGGGAFAGVTTAAQFKKAANGLYRAQKVKDWQKTDTANSPGPRTYFGSARSFVINRFLRTGDTKGLNGVGAAELTDWSKQVADAFGIKGVTLPAGAEVYRAVSDDFATKLGKMKEGTTFVDRGYVSTAGAMTDQLRYNFGNDIMQITTKSDQRVLLHPDELEVLFQSGRKFKYLGKSTGTGKDKGATFYRVEME